MTDSNRLQRVGLLFRSVNVNFREQIDQALRTGGVGLNFGQVSALGVLSFNPGCNGAQLARHCMVSAQAMNNVLRQLVSRQLLERRPNPENRRADSWYLSDKGVRALGRANRIFDVVTSKMLEHLQPTDIDMLEHYLRICSASLEHVVVTHD